jgi:hypothetical protein
VTIAWFSTASLAGQGLPERARRVYTDAQAFEMLGVQTLLGRLPTLADEKADAEPVVVIGYTLWAERFGLNRVVRLLLREAMAWFLPESAAAPSGRSGRRAWRAPSRTVSTKRAMVHSSQPRHYWPPPSCWRAIFRRAAPLASTRRSCFGSSKRPIQLDPEQARFLRQFKILA